MPIVSEVRKAHNAKHSVPRVVTELSILRLINPVDWNAPAPIVRNPVPKVIDARLTQPSKALSPIVISSLLITSDVISVLF